jgi:flagellar biogenesis protein FliO
MDDDLKRMKSPMEEDNVSFKSVLWMFAAMGFVIATIYITLNYGLRRLMGVRAVGAGSVVQLMERVPLDQKSTVYVVRAAGEYLVVGGTDGGLSLLHKLDPQQVEQLEQKVRAQGQGMSPFLQKLLFRKGGSPPPSA